MTDVPAEMAGWIGSIVASVGITVWATRLFKAREKAEDRTNEERHSLETAMATDLRCVRDALHELKSALALLQQTVSATNTALRAQDDRIEGISRNYGPRLAELEQSIVRIDERINTLTEACGRLEATRATLRRRGQ